MCNGKATGNHDLVESYLAVDHVVLADYVERERAAA
jgi:hypothetical protein